MGAGPAGSSAAFFSKYYDKKDNKNILLLEKFPEGKYSTYHHMCGECLSKKTFDEISPIKPRNIIEEINTIKEFVVDEFTIERKLEGYVLDRPKFFSHIIEQFLKRGGGVL